MSTSTRPNTPAEPAEGSGSAQPEPTREQRLAEARRYYDAALARGLEHLFEPRRDTCPWCSSPRLSVRLRSRDLIQRKPGLFTLEACHSCGHVFQNPRLAIEGLNFYYRDFYDGLGTEVAEVVFGHGVAGNQDRARAVAAHLTPENWLDVGTGRGHFPLHAREVLPDTAFDGLDMGEGVTVAESLGRIRRGFTEPFPSLAGQLAGQYDVVSMHHYLEHTRDPRAELDALAAVVRPGGYAEIEMPNTFPRYGRALRSLWVPWFQPQHQHFLPEANLRASLVERGFTPVSIQNFAAHSCVDLTFVAIFAVTALAPDPTRPWAPPQDSPWRAKRHALAWSTVYPALTKATTRGDRALATLLRRIDRGNAYRIVARKDG